MQEHETEKEIRLQRLRATLAASLKELEAGSTLDGPEAMAKLKKLLEDKSVETVGS